ncbi:MAG: exoribonuclease II [Solirubrobacterales bacterium]|nr:MAG: exoribonuclease II [Solirubrobacterales bacterium]
MLARRGKLLVAEPFFGTGPRIAVSRDRRFDAGDLVVLGSPAGADGRGGAKSGRGRGRGRATVVRRLGRPDVAQDVIEALMVDRGLRRSFDPAVEHEAREAAAGREDLAGRRDLRALPTFTIDPVSARDFDDAISAVREQDGSWRVWVHIADVSAYAGPRSLIDREAYRRGCSVYVPGAVEPMLPFQLSGDACSLRPGEDRLAVSVELSVVGDSVRRAAFHRSAIRSDERLDYRRVDQIFADRQAAVDPWGVALAAARAAAGALGARRARQAALVLDSAEPEFSFDRQGNVLAAEPVAQTESHRLIEQLMIAANEQVAWLLSEGRVPALYRVHEPPDGASVERLIDQLQSLGVPTPPVPRGHMTPQQAAALAGEASQLVSDWVARTGRGGRALTGLVLRSLKQARYEHRNLGHAGLQSPRYCHFTSPIRRYPDLICHRALLSVVAGDVPAPEASWVASAGPWASAREREAIALERDADDIARCFLLARLLSERESEAVFEGEVVGVIRAGAFVAFGPDGAFEGMLPVRRLHGEWWELNEQGTILVGTRHGGAIRLGDAIHVRVAGVDAPRGRVDLLPAGPDTLGDTARAPDLRRSGGG